MEHVVGVYNNSQVIVPGISKDFDRIGHACLLHQLPCYSISLMLCTWIPAIFPIPVFFKDHFVNLPDSFWTLTICLNQSPIPSTPNTSQFSCLVKHRVSELWIMCCMESEKVLLRYAYRLFLHRKVNLNTFISLFSHCIDSTIFSWQITEWNVPKNCFCVF